MDYDFSIHLDPAQFKKSSLDGQHHTTTHSNPSAGLDQQFLNMSLANPQAHAPTTPSTSEDLNKQMLNMSVTDGQPSVAVALEPGQDADVTQQAMDRNLLDPRLRPPLTPLDLPVETQRHILEYLVTDVIIWVKEDERRGPYTHHVSRKLNVLGVCQSFRSIALSILQCSLKLYLDTPSAVVDITTAVPPTILSQVRNLAFFFNDTSNKRVQSVVRTHLEGFLTKQLLKPFCNIQHICIYKNRDTLFYRRPFANKDVMWTTSNAKLLAMMEKFLFERRSTSLDLRQLDSLDRSVTISFSMTFAALSEEDGVDVPVWAGGDSWEDEDCLTMEVSP